MRRRGNGGRSECGLVEGLEPRRLFASVGPVQDDAAVRMETSAGRVTIELTPMATPITVANFLKYVKAGLYHNTLFHRSVPGFVVQGGGYKAGSSYGQIETFPSIVNEFAGAQAAVDGAPVNIRGTIGMAKLPNDPNSATSQWFVNVIDNASNLDNQNGGFTVFGRAVGGGMHAVDAINSMKTVDATMLNPAFTDLPATTGRSGSTPARVISARAMEVLPVEIDARARTVVWVDERGASGTLSLSKGSADLKFVGTGLSARIAGGRVIVRGQGVELVDVSARGTDRQTVLSVSSTGGTSPARVGDVAVSGTIGRVNAATAWLEGDLSATGSIGRVDLGTANRSVIKTGGAGAMVLNVSRAIDLSVRTPMRLESLDVDRWEEDALVAAKIEAASIGRAVIGGTFAGSLDLDGGINRFEVDGDITGGNWWVPGKLGQLQARGVRRLAVLAGSIGDVTVTQTIDRSNLVAAGAIGSVTAGGMSRTLIGAARPTGNATDGVTGFQSSTGAVGRVTVTGTFASSYIAGVRVGTVRLARVEPNNQGTSFGIVARDAIARVEGAVGGKSFALTNVTTDVQAAIYFSQRGINPGDFDILS